MKKLILPVIIAATFTACNSNKTETHEAHDAPSSMIEKKAEDIVVNGNNVSVNLTGNDQMLYNISEIIVKAGQTILLTFTNIGKMSKETMGHNFILLKQGIAPGTFGNAAMSAKATDYNPADMESSIIVHTKLLGPGESETIEFAAPEPGTYDYLCSFPGHWGVMKGKLIVE